MYILSLPVVGSLYLAHDADTPLCTILEEHIGVVRCLSLGQFRLISGGDNKKLVVWDYKVHDRDVEPAITQ